MNIPDFKQATVVCFDGVFSVVIVADSTMNLERAFRKITAGRGTFERGMIQQVRIEKGTK
jgi:hypothetical protein